MVDENNNGEDQIVTQGSDNNNGPKNGSSTGLDENIAGLLCYLATFVTGIIFLIIEKSSKFVRFHAMQSIIFFGAILILGYVVDYVPFIGWLLSSLLKLLGFIMWIVLMIKSYQKEYFKLPIIGNIADDFVNKKA